MTRKTLLAWPLALVLAAVPLAFAHDGHFDSGSDPVGPNTHCWPSQNPHDYESSILQPLGGIVPPSVRGDGFADGNLENCETGLHPGDPGYTGSSSDGDPEYGIHAGFLPSGQWASDPRCGYGFVPHHSPPFHVHTVAPAEASGVVVSFTVGADPSPPMISGNSCTPDGCICPDIDPDDWLKDCVHICDLTPPAGNTNPFYGLPGGDGGYHIGIPCGAGTTCSHQGHIYAP